MKQWINTAQEVLAAEGEAILTLRDTLGDNFVAAIEVLLNCRGKVICSGVGKSGHIARKAAATLASTGTPAFYMHPTEAGHGDIGVLSGDDVLLALSHSGESREILELLPAVRRQQAKLIVICGNGESSLAKAATVSLTVHVLREACPLNLAPTASSTATLALTDALAVSLFSARGFSADDFALSHPSGMLGRRLLLRVADVMRSGKDIPVVLPGAIFADALLEMTGKRMGMVLAAEDGQLRGIFTDGDLRRAVATNTDFAGATMAALMTAAPQTVSPTMMAVAALDLMRERQLNHLPVVEERRLVGALSFHDLLAHRLI